MLTSYLRDSCLSNAKSIAQHQGEVRARLTIIESYLVAHLPVLYWAINERDWHRLALSGARVWCPDTADDQLHIDYVHFCFPVYLTTVKPAIIDF